MKASGVIRVLVIVSLLVVPVVALTGCRDDRGPAEKVGDKIDETIEKAKDAIDPKGPAEKAGEKIDKSLGND